MFGEGGWMSFGGGLMLVFWILLAVLIVWLLGLAVPRGRSPGGKSALEILDERYVKGEIGKEEYEQTKRDLSE